jgi:hypothetical protein
MKSEASRFVFKFASLMLFSTVFLFGGYLTKLKNVAQNQLTTSNLLVLTKSHPVDMLHVLRDVELANVAWIQYLNEYCRLIYSGTDEELWVTDRRKISVKMTTPTDFTDSRLKPIVW